MQIRKISYNVYVVVYTVKSSITYFFNIYFIYLFGCARC